MRTRNRVGKVLLFELHAPKSKRRAFYRIWLERTDGEVEWKVVKESGIGEERKRVLDRREWVFEDLRSGLRFLFRKVNNKLNRPEEHPRRYVLVTGGKCDE